MSIRLDNGLAPNSPQAIILTNADPIHWRIYAALGRNEFMQWNIANNSKALATIRILAILSYNLVAILNSAHLNDAISNSSDTNHNTGST